MDTAKHNLITILGTASCYDPVSMTWDIQTLTWQTRYPAKLALSRMLATLERSYPNYPEYSAEIVPNA